VPAERRLPSASSVLRRALLVWGLGHIALGDRRGWLLLPLQPLAVGGLVVVALLLMDSTRWIVVFPCLATLIALWLGQAIHAHQRALRLGAAPGGELQIAWTLPVILALVTGFWLLGGDRGSPAATLQEYVAAWHAGRVEQASLLFADPPQPEVLAQDWQQQQDYLQRRVSEAASLYGTSSGLDPIDPFAGLRYVELEGERSADSVLVAVDIVRRQRVETLLFGLIPTATQETVLVERAGLIHLRAVDAAWPDWLPAGDPPPRVWRVEQVVMPADLGAAARPSGILETQHSF
jgi:hypothetical protein